MLGSGFAFETPNVIDPGDVAPSAPTRSSASSVAGGSSISSIRTSPSSNVTGKPSYQSERTQRLWADISSDVAGAPNNENTVDEESKGFLAADAEANRNNNNQDEQQQQRQSSFRLNNSSRPSYRFEYKDDNSYIVEDQHSLPNVEEARTYAASLLHASNQTRASGSSSHDPFARSVQLAGPSSRRQKSIDRNHSSSKHLVRGQVMPVACKILVILVVLILLILIIVFAVKKGNEGADASAAALQATSSPTPSPTLSRLERANEFIHHFLYTEMVDLNTPGTPQYKAANWIVNMDVLDMDIPTDLDTPEGKRFAQRFILATLYYATNGVDSWYHDAGFLSDQDECGWFDAKLRVYDQKWGNNFALGVTCNTNLEVVNLLFPSNGLEGPLPPEIGYLSALTLISMPHNQLNGTIPYTFVNLTNLEYMDFKFNFFWGHIPNMFSTLTNLQVLGLSNNDLQHSLPPSFATLSNLRILAIDDNSLSGEIYHLNSLLSLEYLYADRNDFIGSVDQVFLANLQQLIELDMSGNQLTSGAGNTVFPKHLLQHPTLKVLDLAENNIKAKLPGGLQDNYVLQFLSLRDNELYGMVNQTSLPMLKGLTHLDISGNKFTGVLPNDMKLLTNLAFLFMGRNHQLALESVPSWLFTHTLLQELSMTDMNLTGSIPLFMVDLTNLTFLDLSHNTLTGNIPSEVLDLPNLEYLLLHNNSLSGSIPETFQNVDKFQFLTLYDNDGFTTDLNLICEEATELVLLAVDCHDSCDIECCPQCCDRNDTTGVSSECFKEDIPTYLKYFEGLWELNYTKSTGPYDPSLLTDKPGKLDSPP